MFICFVCLFDFNVSFLSVKLVWNAIISAHMSSQSHIWLIWPRISSHNPLSIISVLCICTTHTQNTQSKCFPPLSHWLLVFVDATALNPNPFLIQKYNMFFINPLTPTLFISSSTVSLLSPLALPLLVFYSCSPHPLSSCPPLHRHGCGRAAGPLQQQGEKKIIKSLLVPLSYSQWIILLMQTDFGWIYITGKWAIGGKVRAKDTHTLFSVLAHPVNSDSTFTSLLQEVKTDPEALIRTKPSGYFIEQIIFFFTQM